MVKIERTLIPPESLDIEKQKGFLTGIICFMYVRTAII